MSSARRWQGQAPGGSLLHPVWEPVTWGEPSDEAFVARCLLGAGWVGANRRLPMLDPHVWAAPRRGSTAARAQLHFDDVAVVKL
jgi:hypothetical protein